MIKKLLLVLISCFFATAASAETKGFLLSLTPDIAIQSRTTQIDGVSISVWGENPQNSLALGFVNGSTGDSSGLALGLLANYSLGNFKGGQWAPLNYAANLTGFQLGFINFAETVDKGIQIGLVNIISQNKNWFTRFPHEVAPAMVFVNWRY